MIEPEKNLDEALKKSLQLRFKDLEAAVKPSLWMQIKRDIVQPSKAITSYVLGLLLLFCLILICYERQNVGETFKITVGVANKTQSAKKKINIENSGTVLKQTNNMRTVDNLPIGHIDALLTKKMNVRHKKSSAYASTGTPHSVAYSHSLRYARIKENVKNAENLKSACEWKPVISQTDDLKTDTIFSEHDKEMKLEPIIEIEAQLFKNKVKEMDLPPVGTVKAACGQFNGHLKAFDFLFSVTPLQTYQILDITSTAANRFQNIEFAPLLSLKSKGIKLAAGIQKKSIQILINYSFIRNWTYYEVGNGEVIVDQVADDQYILKENGDSYTKNEKLHLLGLGIRQAIALRGPLHAYELKLGADYARLLNEKQGITSVNVALTRPILFFHNQTLSIGPFAELGLNQRNVSGQTWKYRPYQFGISLDLKINNSYLKTIF